MLLGWSKDLDEGGQAYAHHDCVLREVKNAQEITED